MEKEKASIGDIIKTVATVAVICFGAWILSFGFRMVWTMLHGIFSK
jgi:hypothetical protein